MATADKQIRVSETVKRKIERRRREGESYNDVLERILESIGAGDFYDGFGRWSEQEAERVREGRVRAKEKRIRRLQARNDDTR